MSELKIPEAAYTAGANAYDEADPDSRWLEAIDAAAPLIVAAKLRQLATKYREAGLSIAPYWLDNEADELDPQGLTKE